MLWKLLRNELRPLQLTGAFLGGLIGMMIMLIAVMFYLDVSPVFQDKEGFWNEEYLIVNKKILINDTYNQIEDINSEKPSFSKEEIDELRSKYFIKKVAPFNHCTFSISAYTDDESALSGFYTDLFFESVPNDYLDVNYSNWNWDPSMEFIPVVIPKTYLNLYNFGFASSQDLPQISEKSASLVSFNIKIRGQSKSRNFSARIVGFSNRINTILVPESFIAWANTKYGVEKSPNPSRLIVVANDPSDPALLEYFTQHKYDVNESELSNSKALMFLRVIISVVIIIGLIITLLAFWLMLTAILLLLQRNKTNIVKLKILGYSIKQIALPYQIIASIFFFLVTSLSFIPLHLLRKFYSSKLIILGYNMEGSNLLPVILTALSTFIIMLIISLLNIQFKVRQFN